MADIRPLLRADAGEARQNAASAPAWRKKSNSAWRKQHAHIYLSYGIIIARGKNVYGAVPAASAAGGVARGIKW